MFVCPSHVYHMEQLAEISSKYQTVKPVRTGMYVYALGSQAQATGTAPWVMQFLGGVTLFTF